MHTKEVTIVVHCEEKTFYLFVVFLHNDISNQGGWIGQVARVGVDKTQGVVTFL